MAVLTLCRWQWHLQWHYPMQLLFKLLCVLKLSLINSGLCRVKMKINFRKSSVSYMVYSLKSFYQTFRSSYTYWCCWASSDWKAEILGAYFECIVCLGLTMLPIYAVKCHSILLHLLGCHHHSYYWLQFDEDALGSLAWCCFICLFV